MTPILANIDWDVLGPIIFAVIYGLYQWFSSRAESETPDIEPGEAQRRAQQDERVDEAEERARRIREEIRRRIQERQGGGDPSQAPQPAPAAPYQAPPPPPPQRPAPVQRAEVEPVWSDAPSSSQSMYERLREQQQRLKEAEQRKREVMQASRERQSAKRRPAAARTEADALAPAVLRQSLLQELGNPQALRKGILFAEVLGPCLANRRDQGPLF